MNLTEMTDAMLDRMAPDKMGWTIEYGAVYDNGVFLFSLHYWKPSSNIAQAFKFAEKVGLFKDGQVHLSSSPDGIWWIHRYYEQWDDDQWELMSKAPTAARAITEACLLATEAK